MSKILIIPRIRSLNTLKELFVSVSMLHLFLQTINLIYLLINNNSNIATISCHPAEHRNRMANGYVNLCYVGDPLRFEMHSNWFSDVGDGRKWNASIMYCMHSRLHDVEFCNSLLSRLTRLFVCAAFN